MAAMQPTSSQQQTGSSRPQTTSTCIPLQKRAAPSTLQPPTPQSIAPQSHTQLVPVPKPPTSRRIWNEPLTGNMITCVALVVALIFGIGAWIGQAYGNTYARKSYEVTLWGLCLDHPAIQENEVCQERLRDGLHRSVKRDLGLTMQLSALSQVNPFRSHLVSSSTCLSATIIWNFFHTKLTSLSRSIYFDGSFDATEQRWKYGVLKAACFTIPTTITAVWYWFSCQVFLVAVVLDDMSKSPIIACLASGLLIIPWFVFVLAAGTSPDECVTQILFGIRCATNWFLVHQLSDDGITVPEFVYFNLCLAAFELLLTNSLGTTTLGIGPWISKRTD